MPATRDQVTAVLNQMKAIIEGIEKRMKYQAGIDDPYVGVMVNGFLSGQHVAREPWGPFKSPEDARDYLEAKRRAHGPKVGRKYEGKTDWHPEHDGELFCHPGFTYGLIHTREFYAQAANVLMQSATAMLMSTVGETRPEPLPLEPVPSVMAIGLVTPPVRGLPEPKQEQELEI